MDVNAISKTQPVSALASVRPRLIQGMVAPTCVRGSSLLPFRGRSASDVTAGTVGGALATAATKDARRAIRAWSPPIT